MRWQTTTVCRMQRGWRWAGRIIFLQNHFSCQSLSSFSPWTYLYDGKGGRFPLPLKPIGRRPWKLRPYRKQRAMTSGLIRIWKEMKLIWAKSTRYRIWVLVKLLILLMRWSPGKHERACIVLCVAQEQSCTNELRLIRGRFVLSLQLYHYLFCPPFF